MEEVDEDSERSYDNSFSLVELFFSDGAGVSYLIAPPCRSLAPSVGCCGNWAAGFIDKVPFGSVLNMSSTTHHSHRNTYAVPSYSIQ